MASAHEIRSTAVGFAGGLVVLAVLAWVVGVGELFASVSAAHPPTVGAVVVVAGCWLVAWALALRTVLGTLEASISVPRAIAVYAGVLFANNVTPFGQAGGEPVSALLIAESARTEYETALAAVASADSLNVIPSIAIAFVGLAYLSAVRTVAGVWWAVAAVGAVAVGAVVVGFLGWRFSGRLQATVEGAAAALTGAVGRRVPGLEAPSYDAVARRVDGFFRSIEVVATDRRRLCLAVGFATAGWLAQALALWLALSAVGASASYTAVAVAVPLGAIAGVTPLPGGLGGVEAALVALLVSLAGVAIAPAAAAVVLHRGAVYWLPTLVGGGVAAALGASRV